MVRSTKPVLGKEKTSLHETASANRRAEIVLLLDMTIVWIEKLTAAPTTLQTIVICGMATHLVSFTPNKAV